MSPTSSVELGRGICLQSPDRPRLLSTLSAQGHQYYLMYFSLFDYRLGSANTSVVELHQLSEPLDSPSVIQLRMIIEVK